MGCVGWNVCIWYLSGVLGPGVTGTGIALMHALIDCTLPIYESGVAGPRAQ